MVRKSNIKTYTPPEQVKIEPNIAIIKDLLSDNTDGHVIYFYDEAARIAKPDTKDKHRPVVGMPVVSVKIGDHCYHGLCDMGASVSAIPHDYRDYPFYLRIQAGHQQVYLYPFYQIWQF